MRFNICAMCMLSLCKPQKYAINIHNALDILFAALRWDSSNGGAKNERTHNYYYYYQNNK